MVALSVYLNMVFDKGMLAERVSRVADAGFDSIECYGWTLDFEAITDRTGARGLEFVYLSGDRPPLNDPDGIDEAVAQIRESIELAERVNCRNLNVKGGERLDGVPETDQRAAVVDVLERVAPAAENADVTLLIEPLNTRVDHPGHLVSTPARASRYSTRSTHRA